MRFIQSVVLLIALASSPGLSLRLATTTSVYDSGLLDRLLPAFAKAEGLRVEVLAVGTGQALRLAQRGDVDAVLVHAPILEGEALRRGFIAEPFCLAQNAFLLVGPPQDPARVGEAGSVLQALGRIATARAPFVSRGDRSGTHLKELELWQRAGLTPRGSWYLESGAGMGQTLVLAAERGAYTLSDLATYLTVGRKRGLVALYRREDPFLLNQYTYYLVPKGARVMEARALRRFLASEEAARLVEGLQVEGSRLFKPLRGRCIIPRGGGH